MALSLCTELCSRNFIGTGINIFLSPKGTIRGRYHDHPHFTDEETEAQRDSVINWRIGSRWSCFRIGTMLYWL